MNVGPDLSTVAVRAPEELLTHILDPNRELALNFVVYHVVMKDGRVLQVASPAQLFERPEHTFVGYFIGSPGMNLIAAKVSDHVAHVSGHDIELGARYPKIKNGDAVIGFRPDFASLAPGGGIPVQVRRIEDLGRRRLARVGSCQSHASAGHSTVHARGTADRSVQVPVVPRPDRRRAALQPRGMLTEGAPGARSAAPVRVGPSHVPCAPSLDCALEFCST